MSDDGAFSITASIGLELCLMSFRSFMYSLVRQNNMVSYTMSFLKDHLIVGLLTFRRTCPISDKTFTLVCIWLVKLVDLYDVNGSSNDSLPKQISSKLVHVVNWFLSLFQRRSCDSCRYIYNVCYFSTLNINFIWHPRPYYYYSLEDGAARIYPWKDRGGIKSCG